MLLVGNKCEGKAGEAGIAEAWGLVWCAIPVSAAHGDGLGDLHDALVEIATEQGALNELTGRSKIFLRMKKMSSMKVMVKPISGSIRGPAADADRCDRSTEYGQITLINRLLDEERVLTGPEAGITRDAIEIPFNHDGRELVLIDTAGMRRKAALRKILKNSWSMTPCGRSALPMSVF